MIFSGGRPVAIPVAQLVLKAGVGSRTHGDVLLDSIMGCVGWGGFSKWCGSNIDMGPIVDCSRSGRKVRATLDRETRSIALLRESALVSKVWLSKCQPITCVAKRK